MRAATRATIQTLALLDPAFAIAKGNFFGALAQIFARSMLDHGHNRWLRGCTGAMLVGDDGALWPAAELMDKALQRAPRGLGVTAKLDDFVENVAVLVDGAPEITVLIH